MVKGISEERRIRRARRQARLHSKMRGTGERPRLVVSRSLKNLQGQLVDDTRGITLLGVSTRAPAVRERLEEADEEAGTGKRAASFVAGRILAERARETGVEEVVFDRGGYRYHGRVKAFADGARAGGLRF